MACTPQTRTALLRWHGTLARASGPLPAAVAAAGARIFSPDGRRPLRGATTRHAPCARSSTRADALSWRTWVPGGRGSLVNKVCALGAGRTAALVDVMAAASASARGQASLLLMRQLKGMFCRLVWRSIGGGAAESVTGCGCVGFVARNAAFAYFQSLVGWTASNTMFCSLCRRDRPWCV